MTSPQQDSTRASLWRRWAAPFALVVLLAFAGATIARAATPPVDDVVAEIQAPAGRALIPELAAPAPTVSPEPYVSPLEIVLPPPPPPPPTVAKAPSRGSSSQRIQAATSAGVTTSAAWCDGGYGATASASSVSGLLSAVNAERARWGLGALSWNSSLATDAQTWSGTMASEDNLYHGMEPRPGGQNIYFTYYSGGRSESSAASLAHTAWMTSPGHCKIILNANWHTMGAGAASVDGGLTWFLTENFQ